VLKDETLPVLYLDKSIMASQVDEMLEELESYIKLAVDIERGVAAGGGALHADCEHKLLHHGSRQEDIWGADYYPHTGEIRYGALINLAPARNNPSMQIKNPEIRSRVSEIVRTLFPASSP
jgi:hypothetical protein